MNYPKTGWEDISHQDDLAYMQAMLELRVLTRKWVSGWLSRRVVS